MGRAYSRLDRRWHYCAMSLSRIRLARSLRSWATSKPRARHEPLPGPPRSLCGLILHRARSLRCGKGFRIRSG